MPTKETTFLASQTGVYSRVPVNGALLFFPLVLTGVSTKSQSENVMKRQKKTKKKNFWSTKIKSNQK